MSAEDKAALAFRIFEHQRLGITVREIAAVEKLPKSTVHRTLVRIAEQGTLDRKSGSGRPPQWSKLCDIVFGSHWSHFLLCYRFKRGIIRLAQRNPFWGAKKLGQVHHEHFMAGLQSRPVGAVFRVSLSWDSWFGSPEHSHLYLGTGSAKRTDGEVVAPRRGLRQHAGEAQAPSESGEPEETVVVRSNPQRKYLLVGQGYLFR